MTTGARGALRRSPTPAQLAWVEHTVGRGARVVGGRRLLGGISASVHRLSVRRRGGTTVQVVLKRFTDAGWGDLRAIAEGEAAGLVAVEATDVPAPRLLGLDADGDATEGTPSLLMTRAPGRVWLAPADLDAWARQLAALLPRLHVPGPGGRTRRRDLATLVVPATARRPDLWGAARRVVASRPPRTAPVLVHGDYQHFNVLWSRGRLSAVIDWNHARVAAPDIDVGHCRLNLAVLHSVEAAERFRLAYEAEAGRRVEPWWDLHQILTYDDSWLDFIPVQVAGRASLDVGGMTGRVEELLASVLARV